MMLCEYYGYGQVPMYRVTTTRDLVPALQGRDARLDTTINTRYIQE